MYFFSWFHAEVEPEYISFSGPYYDVKSKCFAPKSAQKTWETSADYWRCSAPSLISPLACVFCRLSHVNVSENELECLPLGLLHLGQLKRITAARNKLISLFNIPNGNTHTHTHTPSGVVNTDSVFFRVHQLYARSQQCSHPILLSQWQWMDSASLYYTGTVLHIKMLVSCSLTEMIFLSSGFQWLKLFKRSVF